MLSGNMVCSVLNKSSCRYLWDIPVEVFNRQLEIINLKLRRELGMSIHSKNEHHIKKMWYIYMMEYYSVIKETELCHV